MGKSIRNAVAMFAAIAVAAPGTAFAQAGSLFRIDQKLDTILDRLDDLEQTGAIEPVFVEGGVVDEVNNFFSLTVDVPVGKTLVITHVGANILARDAPEDFRARIGIFCTDTALGVVRNMPLGVLERGPNSAGGTTPNYFFGSPTKIFCTPEFRFDGQVGPGQAIVSVTGTSGVTLRDQGSLSNLAISGYFIDTANQ